MSGCIPARIDSQAKALSLASASPPTPALPSRSVHCLGLGAARKARRPAERHLRQGAGRRGGRSRPISADLGSPLPPQALATGESYMRDTKALPRLNLPRKSELNSGVRADYESIRRCSSASTCSAPISPSRAAATHPVRQSLSRQSTGEEPRGAERSRE